VAIGLISTALSTTLVALAQSTLNQYWENARGADLREARIGVGVAVGTGGSKPLPNPGPVGSVPVGPTVEYGTVPFGVGFTTAGWVLR